MDDYHVHNFWGFTSFVDFGGLLCHLQKQDAKSKDDVSFTFSNKEDTKEVNLLQIGSCDCRHTVATMCRTTRHQAFSEKRFCFYIYEVEPEVLARHILLISVLLDKRYPVRNRVELFLEIHGNILLSEKTAKYLEMRAAEVEEVLMALNSGEVPGGALGELLDISLLKYEERDLVAAALKSCSRKTQYDMAQSWDARLRRHFGERYDFRQNLVDWDYHMQLQRDRKDATGLGRNAIIHFSHFREWRMHGIAHELRDIVYNECNRSLLSTAFGRSKEFKDKERRGPRPERLCEGLLGGHPQLPLPLLRDGVR
uniref:Dynein assembly factor axonemal-like n=1 Tax=Tetraselmis sp. GSL018 TaxID=582737 RepID=A0A061R8M2_9CHLO